MTVIRTLLTASILAASIGAAQAQMAPATPGPSMSPTLGGMPMGPGGRPGMGGQMGGQTGGEMGRMMPMVGMVMPRGMQSMAGLTGMMAPEHVEGRIAFLKTELQITDTQLPQWNAYADVLRTNATKMSGMRWMAMQSDTQMSAVDRGNLEMGMLMARLEVTKAESAAATALYAILTDAQKKAADELLTPVMGGM